MQSTLKLINNTLTYIIVGLRPLLGPAVCKFHVSCTQFAIQQLKTQSTPQALKAITVRLFRCSPFTRGR